LRNKAALGGKNNGFVAVTEVILENGLSASLFDTTTILPTASFSGILNKSSSET
jgi:hypothetical protein